MTVKETYHADCLRIKQLEQQLARYEEYIKFIHEDVKKVNDKVHGWKLWIMSFKDFESEQNDKGT